MKKLAETNELDIANSVFVDYLKKRFGWQSVPAESMFSLWIKYGQDFQEAFRVAWGQAK